LDWVRTVFEKPDQIGWHRDAWSIYASTDDGPCVLSSGVPLFYGPEHFPNVKMAQDRADETSQKEQGDG